MLSLSRRRYDLNLKLGMALLASSLTHRARPSQARARGTATGEGTVRVTRPSPGRIRYSRACNTSTFHSCRPSKASPPGR